jgi:hypothetical protein
LERANEKEGKDWMASEMGLRKKEIKSYKLIKDFPRIIMISNGAAKKHPRYLLVSKAHQYFSSTKHGTKRLSKAKGDKSFKFGDFLLLAFISTFWQH